MNTFIESIDSQTVLVIAAIVVSILSATLLFRLLKTSAGLILALVAIVLGLQYLFGISPNQLWGEIGSLTQDVTQLVRNVDLSSLTSVFSG